MPQLLRKYSILFLVAVLGFQQAQGQAAKFNYHIGLNTGISSEEIVPFWLAANRYGAIPTSDHLLLNAALFSNFKKPENDFGIAYKISATGFIANENSTTGYIADENTVLINELFLRLHYKN